MESGGDAKDVIVEVGRAMHDAGEFDPSTCFPNEKLRLQELEWRHTDTCYALPLLDGMLYRWDFAETKGNRSTYPRYPYIDFDLVTDQKNSIL